MSTGSDWCSFWWKPSIFQFFLFLFLVFCIAQAFFSIVLYLQILFTMHFFVVHLNNFWLKSKLPWRFWSLMCSFDALVNAMLCNTYCVQCRRGFCSKTHWAVYVGSILRHHRCKWSSKRLQLDIWPNSTAALHASRALNAVPQCIAVSLVIKMAYEAYTYNSFETKVLIKNCKKYYFTLYLLLITVAY